MFILNKFKIFFNNKFDFFLLNWDNLQSFDIKLKKHLSLNLTIMKSFFFLFYKIELKNHFF